MAQRSGRKREREMIQTDNTTLAVAQAMITLRDENKALKAENEKLKSDLKIQKNLTNQACFESNRAYQEMEKWKKRFYDLIDKQSSVSTDPKVIIVGKDINVRTKESEGEDEL